MQWLRNWQRKIDCPHHPSYPNVWARRAWVRLLAIAMAHMGNPNPSLVSWTAVVLLVPNIGAWGALAAALGWAIYKTLKRNTARLRPFEKHPHITAYSKPPDPHSFPSGHTLNAVVLAMTLTYAFVWLAPVALLWIVLMGVSRVVLGLHYPSDVLAGGLLGGALGIGAILAAARWPLSILF